MVFSFFSSLLSTFLTIHSLLYHPTFAAIPEHLYDPQGPIPLTLSVKSSHWKPAPQTFASGAIVIDQQTSEILFEQNAEKQLEPASTTKIMTALLAIENYDQESIASVSSGLAHDGSGMGLQTGEHIKVKDLMAGLLVPSANDAADELSRLYPGGTDAFVQAMNTRARELGLTHTQYNNPIGYIDPAHVTTVRDLAILAREAMTHPEFASMVKVQSMKVTNQEKTIVHTLHTTNELLGSFEGIEGIKTGWTQEAGECFVAQATRGNQTYIVVVLHSPDRFKEARALLEWAFANYSTETQTVTP